MYAVIVENLADRKSMDDPVAEIVCLTMDGELAHQTARKLANEYGLVGTNSDNWWDKDEGFIVIHIQEV